MFGRRLRELRERTINPKTNKKMTQQDLADAFNLAKSTISQYENGINEPNSLEIVKGFADYFGVTTDYLLGKVDEPNAVLTDETKEFLKKVIELSDEELLKNTQFTYKGQPISEEKMKALFQILRIDEQERRQKK